MSELTPVTREEMYLDEIANALENGGGGGGGGTSDYSQLSNKPKINNVELNGNKSLADIGAQPTIDSSHKLSADLVDDTSTTNKFATASELEQIQTNKTNILTLTPTVAGGLIAVTSNYSCISSLTQTIPVSEGTNPSPVARISAMIAAAAVSVRGIILSLSNDSTTYDNGSNLLARIEQQSAIQAALSVSTLFYNTKVSTNVPIYVWLKGSGSGNVRAYSTLEYLRR